MGKATGTPATTALTSVGISFTPHTYEHDPRAGAYGMEAAEALGIDPARVFKTLVADAGGTLVVGIVPVDRHLDLKALAAAMGAKHAVLAEPTVAQRATGYVVGGISPIGSRRQLVTVLDESALDHDTILVSGGRRGFDIELTPADLLSVTGGRTAVIRRAPVDPQRRSSLS